MPRVGESHIEFIDKLIVVSSTFSDESTNENILKVRASTQEALESDIGVSIDDDLVDSKVTLATKLPAMPFDGPATIGQLKGESISFESAAAEYEQLTDAVVGFTSGVSGAEVKDRIVLVASVIGGSQ